MIIELTLDEAFDLFAQHWGGVHLMRHEDSLVYKVVGGYGKKAAFNANTLLRDLGMDGRLEAVAGGLPSDDSFCVKLKTQ